MLKVLKKSKFPYIAFFHVVILLCVPTLVHSKERQHMTIGAGCIFGVYYPVASAICKFVNKSGKNITCIPQITCGSAENIELLEDGATDVIIMEMTDYLSMSPNQQKKFSYMFSLHKEVLTILVKEGSEIKEIDDIRGYKITKGPKGDSVNHLVDKLIAYKGWDEEEDFEEVKHYKYEDYKKALCNEEVDVEFIDLGHPNAIMQDILSECPVRAISLPKEEIDAISMLYPGVVFPARVGDHIYSNMPGHIESISTMAGVFARTGFSDEMSYTVTASVFNNLQNFRKYHIALKPLKRDEMASAPRGVRRHQGVEQYLKEHNIIVT